MKICDLQSSAGRLSRVTRELKECWASTKEHWIDQKGLEFEETHLRPILPEVTMALAAVHRLNEVLERVERELEDGQD